MPHVLLSVPLRKSTQTGLAGSTTQELELVLLRMKPKSHSQMYVGDGGGRSTHVMCDPHVAFAHALISAEAK
jgi:hypothetical protein